MSVYATHASNLLKQASCDRQLAEEYGAEVASNIVSKSRSSLRLSAMPVVPYSRSRSSLFSRVGSFLGQTPRK